MTYRGKYPHRIAAVYSVKGRPGLTAQTNAEFRYTIVPATVIGRSNMPKPGVDISSFIRSPHFVVTALDGDVRNARG